MLNPRRSVLIGAGVAFLALCAAPVRADEESESKYKKHEHEHETEVIQPGDRGRVIERHERVYEPSGDAPIVKHRNRDVDVKKKSEHEEDDDD